MTPSPPPRVRIAPSPTGSLHVGTARAALFNELFARKHGGSFIVRIEDTDRERSQSVYEKEILAGLRWLGLHWDEGPDIGGPYGPYRQSERGDRYRAAIQQLLESGHAHREEGGEAIHLRVAAENIVFDDLIRGSVTVHSDSWGGDFVIARSVDDPVFHLAVVVDDAAQEISHIIRGEDHISNTGRHILIQRALNLPTPQYAHLPLLLDEKRRKLSKRSGEVSLLAYREMGYLPEAMLNYLALLGWNPGNDREFFSHEELVQAFSLDRVQKGGAIFSLDKLNSINQHYIREQSVDDLFELTTRYAADVRGEKLSVSREALATEHFRVHTLEGLIGGTAFARSVDWGEEYDSALLVWRKSDRPETLHVLQQLHEKLKSIAESDYQKDVLEKELLAWIAAESLDRGTTLWPMRVALTGREHSPGPFEVAAVLGKTTVVSRIERALAKLAV